MTRAPSIVLLVALVGTAHAAEGAAAPAPQELALTVGAGLLGSPGLGGGALALGLRYRPGRWVALGFDLGYGVVGGATEVQDRWWLMPSVALVIPAGPAQIDLGAGLGLGATSGYRSFAAYLAAPFDPVWALQLVPTGRGHVMASLPLTRKVELFARVDLAALILEGNAVGSRVGNPDPGLTDRIWYDVLLGVRLRLLP